MNHLAPAQPPADDSRRRLALSVLLAAVMDLIDISIVNAALPTIRDGVNASAVALPVLVLVAPQQARYGRRHDSLRVPPALFRECAFTGRVLDVLTSLLRRRRLLPRPSPWRPTLLSVAVFAGDAARCHLAWQRLDRRILATLALDQDYWLCPAWRTVTHCGGGRSSDSEFRPG
jgi:hypothetical protein